MAFYLIISLFWYIWELSPLLPLLIPAPLSGKSLAWVISLFWVILGSFSGRFFKDSFQLILAQSLPTLPSSACFISFAYTQTGEITINFLFLGLYLRLMIYVLFSHFSFSLFYTSSPCSSLSYLLHSPHHLLGKILQL